MMINNRGTLDGEVREDNIWGKCERENQRLYSLPRGDRGSRWIVRMNVIRLQIAIIVSRLRPTTKKTLMIRMGSLLT